MEDIWSRFDFIGVADYIPYKWRVEKLDRGFARVGIGTRAEKFWDFDSPFKDRLYLTLRRGAGIGSPGALGCALNHYRMWRTAYGLGRTCGLFMEDDVEFLKDLGTLGNTVSSLPGDFDIALFDWFAGHATTAGELKDLAERPRENGHWADIRGVTLVSAGMYALSRRGMEFMIRSMEAGADEGSKVRATDTFFRPARLDPSLKAVCAFPHVAIQGDVERGLRKTSKRYDEVGVDKGDYE